MINLGLNRIRSLLHHLGNPHHHLKTIHVAGTNGKGSVCTYVESILQRSGLTTAKFTSPHLLYPHDAFNINQHPISFEHHQETTSKLRDVASRHGISATPFETETAAAFQMFREAKVDCAVIEVGLGGLEDATNVLDPPNVLCSAITRVGVDHEGFLGSDIVGIARHKAGIAKEGVPLVLDGSNTPAVVAAVSDFCEQSGSPLVVVEPRSPFWLANQAVASEIIHQAFPSISPNTIDQGIAEARWPGRLEWLGPKLLVDGAHNPAAASELRRFVDSHVGSQRCAVRWVLGFSKPPLPILQELVRPGDEVWTAKFADVDGMPWIKAEDPSVVAELARQVGGDVKGELKPHEVFEDEKLTVVAGSLYLVADLLRSKRVNS